jgi:plastocyanin
MRCSLKHLAAIVIASLSLHGCNEERATQADKPRVSGPSAAGGIGSIRGTVSLRGKPPEMREIDNRACHAGATPLREETVVADEKGRLANVVVFLREAPTATAPLPAPLEFDQKNCRYVPHVIALRTRQVLRVKNSDPAIHNVHTMTSANPARNFSMYAKATPVDVSFERPEEFTVRCDVHPWMIAKLHVFDHDQFTVTADDGSFALNNVPAGQYTLVFRHELFGDVEDIIELADKQTLTKDATYVKPQ